MREYLPWTESEWNKALHLKFKKGMDYREIGREIGREMTSVALKFQRTLSPEIMQKLIEENTTDYNKFMYIMGDALIIGDLHSPLVNMKLLEKAVNIAKKLGIRKVIIGGDLFDGKRFSRFMDRKSGTDTSWQFEQSITFSIIEYLAKNFDYIYILKGNHDDRPLKMMLMEENMKDLFGPLADSIKDKIYVSDYGHCVLNKTWRVTHPDAYSRTPGSAGAQLASIHRQNIISFHEHHICSRFDISGNNVVINGGTMSLRHRTEYTSKRDTTNPIWNEGFVIIKNNHHYLFAEGMTDWKHWLK